MILVFESFNPRQPSLTTRGELRVFLRVFVLKTCPTPPTGPGVLTKITKGSTRDAKSAREAHTGGDLPKTFGGYGESTLSVSSAFFTK